MNKLRILNAEFDAITLEQTVAQILAAIRQKRRGWLCTVNVAILMMMRDSPGLQRFVDNAAWVVADGQPLLWTAPIFGGQLPERVTGVDLFDEITGMAETEGLGIYLLGAKNDVVEAVGEKLKVRYPKINICGIGDGYFSEDEAVTRADAVRESGAKILFVAMGVPKQEQFIEEQWERLGVNFAIGIGGSFEVLAGHKKRAPVILQRIGMEWFFRLLQEPQRLWKRYLTTNTRFLYLVCKAAISRSITALGFGR